MVERAKRRSEMPDTLESRVFIESLPGPIYFRVILTGEGAGGWPVDDVVDRIVAGFRT